ncbi:MAG: hypothetical protein AB1830_17315 [Pseudomonadota bacterium]
MSIEFTEKSTLGGGWSLEVRQGHALLGHVRKTDSGVYQYFRGPNNVLTPSLENTDLQALKAKISSTL